MKKVFNHLSIFVAAFIGGTLGVIFGNILCQILQKLFL